MASNDQWPPVAATGKNSSKNRSNINIKKPTKEHQQQVLSTLTEMFQSTLESQVILSVAHSCDWELQSCIDALIAISSTVEFPSKEIQDKEAFVLVSGHSKEPTELYTEELQPSFVKMNQDELDKQREELKKFEKIKKTSSKNRMGSFRGNISKLNSNFKEHQNESNEFDSIWDLPTTQNHNQQINWGNNNAQYALPQMPSNPWTVNYQKAPVTNKSPVNLYQDTPLKTFDKTPLTSSSNINKQKTESDFCGLKVQYRTAGMESSSEDDDADVVIEEELNCTIPTSLPVNVSQLLSSSSQTPPRVSSTQKAITVTTASPPRTPKRSIHHTTIDRIKKAIKNDQKIMIIMRGLPGSGKSFLAKNIITSTIEANPAAHIFSSDDYFVLIGRGIYKYDSRKLDDAHTYNQKRVFTALKEEKTPIIVDNTNLQAWEMRPYAAMAVKNGYIVEILESNSPWAHNVNELAKKNSHGVPNEKIRQMMEKYEPGITGVLLMNRFSLKYEPGKEPKNIRDVEKANEVGNNAPKSTISPLMSENMENKKIFNEPEVSSRSGSAFVDYLQHFDDSMQAKEHEKECNFEESSEKLIFKGSPEDRPFVQKIDLLQALGAIGSERKNSLVPQEITSPVFELENSNSDNNENNLSHRWDFTVTIDDEKIHSTAGTEKSPVNLAEIQKQDAEFGKEIKREEGALGKTCEDEVNDCMRNAVHELLNELAQGYNDAEFEEEISQLKQSTVVITEVFDEKNVPEAQKNISEVIEHDDKMSSDSKQDDDQNENSMENNLQEENIVMETEKEKEELITKEDEPENTSGEIEDASFIDAQNLLDVESSVEELKEANQSKSTFGVIFDIIKTSILGNSTEEDNFQTQNNEIEEAKELKEYSENQHNSNPKSISPDNEIIEALITSNINVIENPIAEIRAAINSTDNGIINTEIINCDKLDDNEFYSLENENFEDFKNKELENIESSNENKDTETLDNINRITWKESPFPVDDLPLPIVNLIDEETNKNIQKSDAETNTTYYDFNVLYVGGTSDSAYRVIQAYNRHINDGPPLQASERPPLKLMLDKSSITGDIFTREGNPELEDEEEKKDRIPELMELFPHIPRDYLMEIFEKVKGDFNWAVELLLEVNPEDISMKIFEEETTEVVEEEVLSDSNVDKEQDEYFSTDDEKDVGLIFDKTERLSEIKTDSSDDICSTSTASASRTESTEDEKTTDNDELLELNLGFDFIKALEQQFGDPDFQVPDGFVPVMQIKKSMAEQLYACWIESMYQQLNARHEQLDQMIAKDAEFARSLEHQLELQDAKMLEKLSEPNLVQIMDMELALAKYKNELKSSIARETPDDLAARLSRQMLNEALPDMDPDTFNEILKAHNGNFKEAFLDIEINTGKSIVPCDTLKKQKLLMEKIKEEDGNLKEKNLPIIVVRSESKDEKQSYKAALANARDSRQEAQRQFSLKVQNYNKAAEAYRKGYPQVAAYYSQMARLHSKKIDAAHAAAACAFVEAQAWDDEDTLDLHNLFVSEALIALDEFLDYHLDKLARNNKRSSSIYIITGRGARSNNGTSKIKPAVSQRLASKNIKFSETNPGCLKVTLYKKNGTD